MTGFQDKQGQEKENKSSQRANLPLSMDVTDWGGGRSGLYRIYQRNSLKLHISRLPSLAALVLIRRERRDMPIGWLNYIFPFLLCIQIGLGGPPPWKDSSSWALGEHLAQEHLLRLRLVICSLLVNRVAQLVICTSKPRKAPSFKCFISQSFFLIEIMGIC